MRNESQNSCRPNCDLLILTAKFGSGHLSVTNAIIEHMAVFEPSMHIRVADLYEILYPRKYKQIYKTYIHLVKKVPRLFNAYYFIKEKSKLIRKIDTHSKKGLDRLSDFIKNANPKAILSTFPTCTGYVSRYKKEMISQIPLLTCITDIVASWEWIYPMNDLYFVAHASVRNELIEKRINKNQICVTGIPVKSIFLKKIDRLETKKKLGYRPEDRIILMMGGGLGLLPENPAFYEWLNSQENCKLILITSQNKRLFHIVDKLNLPNIQIIEFSDIIHEYMQIADFLVGKAGGVTLFEAISSLLPMIVYKPILGQEKFNSAFICTHQMGEVVENLKDLKQELMRLLNTPKHRKIFVENVGKIHDSINMSLLGQKIVEAIHGDPAKQ